MATGKFNELAAIVALATLTPLSAVAVNNAPMKGTYHVWHSFYATQPPPYTPCNGLPGGLFILNGSQQGPYPGYVALEGSFHYPGPSKNGAESIYDTYQRGGIVHPYNDAGGDYHDDGLLLLLTWPSTSPQGVNSWSGAASLVANQNGGSQTIPVTFSETIRFVNSRSFVMSGTVTFNTPDGPCIANDEASFVRTGN
jgi:hypothetical protein